MVNTRGICGVALLIAFTSAWGVADGGSAHQKTQTRPIQLGTSGGNVNDKSRSFCCSGTLGALVTKNGTPYVLSNNHVLGRADKALGGEDVSQPGLIDSGCRVPSELFVADFSEAAPLGQKNVDAALAAVRAGQVDTNGSILDIGPISSLWETPTLSQAVMKSGRTTGFTTGSVSSISTDVNVQYQSGCGSGKKFTIFYNDQIVIGGSGFSAGGDSGSLIVSNDSCKRPVGLLFAGSSTTTIANPIGDVIAALSSPSSPLSFVGSPDSCPVSATASSTTTLGPSQTAVDHAQSVKGQHRANVLSMPNVLGIGVGAAYDNPLEAVIVIYVETGRPLPEAVPDFLDGLRVKVVTTEPFVAYGNQAWGDNRCSGK